MNSPRGSGFVAAGIILLTLIAFGRSPAMSESTTTSIELPAPRTAEGLSVETALSTRRSVRQFADTALSTEELGQLVWAAQGITRTGGYRTAPSAGALYPLEIFMAIGPEGDIPAGVYRYDPARHALTKTADGDRRAELSEAALSQGSVRGAPAVMVICAVFQRVTRKYGDRGMQYTFQESGHAAQNVHLQAVSLGLGSVPVGAFRGDPVRRVLGAGENEVPVYIIPIGHPAGTE